MHDTVFVSWWVLMARRQQQQRVQSPRNRELFSPEDDDVLDEMVPNEWRKRPGGWRPPHLLTWFLLLVLVGLVMTLAYLKDEAPVWDEDLRHTAGEVQVESQENAVLSAPTRMKTMLASAGRVVLDRPEGPAWRWDTPTLARWLEEKGTVLDNFRDLLEEKEEEWRPRNLLWQVENLGADQQAWKTVMVLKQVEVEYLTRRGNEEMAFLAAVDMAVMACLLERLDTWPSFMERALDLHEAAAQSLAVLLQNTRLPEPVLMQLQLNEYGPWEASNEHLGAAMKGYYGFERKLLLGPDKGEPPLPLEYQTARSGWMQFKPNATLRLFADSFRELADASKPAAFTKTSQLSHRLYQQVSGVQGIGNPNSTGEKYFASRIVQYAGLPERLNLARAKHTILMTLFSVRRSVAAEMRVPMSLEELVPKYLEAVPKDPFTGEPIGYNAAHGLIYSVGLDLKDDGGRPTEVPLSDILEPTVQTGIGVARAR
ncbi:hypothetical protein [Phragmitibacter flavus]|uniref:hypothetical protein n=1 Tax=Phragmitibacter flavus TaxID=2576071 RepID=UPI0019804661|nr:hypothetical protein [Phragmitibacter flavus]